jgi:hypothetical protein
MTPSGRDDEPVFAPTHRDYDRTRQRIQQRRKSKTRVVALAASGAAVAGIAAVGVSLSGGSTLVLEQNQPARGATASSPAVIAAASTPAAANSGGPALSRGNASTAHAAHSVPGPTLPPQAGSPQPRSTPRPAEAGVTRSYSGDSSGGVHVGGTTCNGQVGGSQTHTQDTFCADGYASETKVDAQRRVPIRSSVCENKAELSSASLSFNTEREVDYAVYRGSTLIWRWSAGRPAARSVRHSLAIDPGECWSWQTSWRAVDADGRSLHGDFVLETTSYAKELKPFYNPVRYRFSL